MRTANRRTDRTSNGNVNRLPVDSGHSGIEDVTLTDPLIKCALD
jgi:hypothetical protein